MFVKGCGRGNCSRLGPGGDTGIQPAQTSIEASSELMRSIETPGNHSPPSKEGCLEIVLLLNYFV
jgi:hypothetical protein